VIDMELLSVIRRWHYRDHFSIREISRRTGLSRNTVRKYLRSDSVEPKFAVPDRPSKLDPYADKLSHMLRREAGKSRKQKRTVKQLHADLAALGYDGSYNRVAAFARDWKATRQQEQKTCGRGVFVPLAFLAGEAFQFDWSEDWAVIGGERTKLQVAHFKLSYSRAFILRAYLQHDEQAVLAAVELALEAGAPTKTHILNVLHRLVDGKPIDPPAVKPPNALTLIFSALVMK
jgi:transposase